MSEIKHAYPLILNKVASPHYATPTLRRPRLIEWLKEASSCRAAVIAADAGYGKTTLLWQWEREAGFPCYWYKLDRNDRDWTFHISYLIEAISKRHKGFGRRANSMLQQLGGPGSSRPGVAAYLLAEMHERLTEPCTFIIDDWQYVNAVTEVRGLWNQILRDAPPTCRFVFASRVKPRLQFARFKTHGGYAELRTDALRFTEPEIEELFRDIYNDPLERSELEELERRTEGWAASLQLVEVSLRERTSVDDRRTFIESITATSDSDLFDFLAEEVLDQQPEETRNFLLTTSILQQITPEVAERLAGVHDGQRELDGLEYRGLFTNRLDEKRYRYHNLFRDFLERRLVAERSDAEVIGLHIHAASYFETTEQWPDAIHHYLRAGLQRQAARLIAKYGEDVVSSGRLGQVDEWLRMLPVEAIRQNARLSLLFGEAAGIRGQRQQALEALVRARDYFVRKGDRRLQALACLKLSSVYSNSGDIESAAAAADEGVQLVAADDVATRLRLEGNLAITRVWSTGGLRDVVRECQRIAVESASGGMEHFAAIALHNAGSVQLRMGEFRDAIQSLERAATFWAGTPTSPFMDNAELASALVASGQPQRALDVAREGVARTRPWPRPQIDALYGYAGVLMSQDRAEEALGTLVAASADREVLGALHQQIFARLIECLYLTGRWTDIAAAAATLLAGPAEVRYRSEVVPALAIARHVNGPCKGSCQRLLADLREAESAGARYTAAVGVVKLGALSLDHRSLSARRAWQGLVQAQANGFTHGMRWWLRRFARHVAAAPDVEGGVACVIALLDADPEGWREAAVTLIGQLDGALRSALLAAIARNANRSTVANLETIPGRDVLEVVRRLRDTQAPRLYLRTFGGVSLRRGDWNGPEITIDKRRVRALVGVLAAFAHTSLSRDKAIDILWPEADADSAVNSLNQSVFQLRRYIDPEYRAGDRPEYVVSTSDHVGLSRHLVRTDVDEVSRLIDAVRAAPPRVRNQAYARAAELVRGEFLEDLGYESWASRLQLQVHTRVRSQLLPVAVASVDNSDREVAIAVASALVRLDPYDEAAIVALARGLAESGRRVAAQHLLVEFSERMRDELEDATPASLGATIVGRQESNAIDPNR